MTDPFLIPITATVQPLPFQEFLVAALFIVFAVTMLTGAAIAARSRRVIHSVCGLALSSVGLAGLYYFLNSPFLALMEILIYIGAVCITVVFAIMLSEPDELVNEPSDDEAAAHHRQTRRRLLSAGTMLMCALVFAVVSWLGLSHPWPESSTRIGAEPVEQIGIALLSTYMLPFELISVVLLLAIIGALVISRTGRSHS